SAPVISWAGRGMTTGSCCAVFAAPAPAIEYYAADSAVAATTSVPHPYPVGGGDAFVKQALSDWQQGTARVFCVLVDHLEAGVVGLGRVDHGAGTAEVGYWIARPFWGQGVATRAVSHLVRYAGDNLGLTAIWASHLERNPASGRVLAKNGFTCLGRFVTPESYLAKFAGEPALRYCHRVTAEAQLNDPLALVSREAAA
ncbi:MAG: GNAT family N-acetyltransferase, partial [Planctomycetota bacterium]|nr:GNAT family N-acetyltransferase [Planctomycetota bacterium]